MTRTDICNLSLLYLGIASISDISDTSDVSATTCSKAYDTALRTALRDHPWGFAKAEEALSLDTDYDQYPSYDYAYQYPKDCLRPLKIYNEDKKNSKKIEYDVQINKTRTGKVILTNKEEAILTYIVYIDDPNLYDGWFIEMLARCIASMVAIKLTGDSAKAKYMLEAYTQARDEAQTVSGNENFEENVFYNDYLQIRK